MKKIRLFALLCAIVLTLSLAPMASAATRSRVAVDGVFSWDNTRMIKNGETASFNVAVPVFTGITSAPRSRMRYTLSA